MSCRFLCQVVFENNFQEEKKAADLKGVLSKILKEKSTFTITPVSRVAFKRPFLLWTSRMFCINVKTKLHGDHWLSTLMEFWLVCQKKCFLIWTLVSLQAKQNYSQTHFTFLLQSIKCSFLLIESCLSTLSHSVGNLLGQLNEDMPLTTFWSHFILKPNSRYWQTIDYDTCLNKLICCLLIVR